MCVLGGVQVCACLGAQAFLGGLALHLAAAGFAEVKVCLVYLLVGHIQVRGAIRLGYSSLSGGQTILEWYNNCLTFRYTLTNSGNLLYSVQRGIEWTKTNQTG